MLRSRLLIFLLAVCALFLTLLSQRPNLFAFGSSTMPRTNSPKTASPDHGFATLALRNGDFYTGDPAHPRAKLIAITGETIGIVTDSDADWKPWIGPQTRVIDLHGQFAMPGFNDAHVHLASAGYGKLEVNLEGAKSLAEFQQRIRARLKDFKPGDWITGRGWDHTLWPQKVFPTRQDLDAVSTDHPMIFFRVDGHVAIANSRALQFAGITRSTSDPPAGHIVRDPKTGEPTGMLEEDSAMGLVSS